jgi:TonB family protein
MADAHQLTENSNGTADRRSHARRQIQSLAYVDLGEDNGGLVLNMGEGGIGVRSAVGMATDVLPKIRFQMPQSLGWVEATGRIAWTGDSKRMAGIEFIDLPEDAGNQIRKWMTSEEQEVESLSDASEVEEQGASLDGMDGAEAAAPGEAADVGVESEAPSDGASSAEMKPTPSAKTSAMLIALANKATARAATAPVAKVAASEPEAEINEETEAAAGPRADGRPAESLSSWAGKSILNLSVADSAAEEPEKREPRRWLQIAGLVVILAGLSFYLGISASRVGFHEILASVKSLFTGGNAANGAQHGGTDTTTATSASLAPVQAASPNVANSGDAGATPLDANGASAAPANGGAPVQPSNKTAPSFTVRRAASGASSSSNGSANAGAADGATQVLSLPDAPVSASNSVAVSARIYIPLPEETGPQHAGNLQIGRLDRRTEIAYPPDAAQQRIEGIVKLHIVIGPDGAVRSVAVLSGDSTLATAATDAICQWQYKPTMLDGQPIETEADVTVTFRLPQVTQ